MLVTHDLAISSLDAGEPTGGHTWAEHIACDSETCTVARLARDPFRAAVRPVEREGMDTERLARVRFTLIDDIGTELSRELAQGNPFEPYDRVYVAKIITRVLDAARDRASLAAGRLTPAALAREDAP